MPGKPGAAESDAVLARRRAPCPGGCTCAELSHVLRRVLDSVASGQVKASSPQERRLVRRVESALAAFEAGWGILGPDRGHGAKAE